MLLHTVKVWYARNAPDIGDHIILLAVTALVCALYYSEARLIWRYSWAWLNHRVFTWPAGVWRGLIHIVAIIGLALLAWAHFVEPRLVEVNTINLTSSKLHNISLRVVLISDLHSEAGVLNEDKLAGIINPLKPDIIVFAGDAINSIQGLDNFKRSLSSLSASLGKFAVKGNVDQWHWRKVDLFSGTGFELIAQKNLLLQKDGQQFYLSGLDFGQSDKAAALLGKRSPGLFTIFLYHTPDLVERVIGVDLYLCGHTHAGQVRLPFYGAIITFSRFGKKYEAGPYRVKGTALYVNRGLGLDGGLFPRVRFLCRPQITVIDVWGEA